MFKSLILPGQISRCDALIKLTLAQNAQSNLTLICDIKQQGLSVERKIVCLIISIYQARSTTAINSYLFPPHLN
jgi:hypothetical protein